MTNLDKKIIQIQKSTRTLFPKLIPLHNFLRCQFRWYYLWHLYPYFKQIHWTVLGLYLILIISVIFSNIFISPISRTMAQPPLLFSDDFEDNNFDTNKWEIKYDLIPGGDTNLNVSEDSGGLHIVGTVQQPGWGNIQIKPRVYLDFSKDFEIVSSLRMPFVTAGINLIIKSENEGYALRAWHNTSEEKIYFETVNLTGNILASINFFSNGPETPRLKITYNSSINNLQFWFKKLPGDSWQELYSTHKSFSLGENWINFLGVAAPQGTIFPNNYGFEEMAIFGIPLTLGPSAPQNLTATQVANGIQLNWLAPSEPNIASYKIYRRKGTETEKWTVIDQVSDPRVRIVAQNGRLEFLSSGGTFGVIQSKSNGNFNFINPNQDFSISYSVIFGENSSDQILAMVGFGFEGGPEPVMLYTKTVNGVRYLYGGADPISYYNGEKILVNCTYTKATNTWNKKMKLEGDEEWRLDQNMTWEGSDNFLPQLVAAYHFTGEGQPYSNPVPIAVYFDDIRLEQPIGTVLFSDDFSTNYGDFSYVFLNSVNHPTTTYTDNTCTSEETTYYMVTAVNTSDQEGLPSNLASAVCPQISDITPPANVTNVSAVASNKQITLNWTNPSDSDFKGVRICYRTNTYPAIGNPNDGICINKTGNPNETDSKTITNLTNGTTYYFRLYAYDEVPNYADGTNTQVQAKPFRDDITPPAKITDLKILNIKGKPPFKAYCEDYTSTVFQWTAPGDDGMEGGPVKSYMFRYKTSSSDDWIVNRYPEITPGSPGQKQTYTYGFYIKSGEVLYAQIRAKDDAGNWSDWSNLVQTDIIYCTPVWTTISRYFLYFLTVTAGEPLEDLKVQFVDIGFKITKNVEGDFYWLIKDPQHPSIPSSELGTLTYDVSNPYKLRAPNDGTINFAGKDFVFKKAGRMLLYLLKKTVSGPDDFGVVSVSVLPNTKEVKAVNLTGNNQTSSTGGTLPTSFGLTLVDNYDNLITSGKVTFKITKAPEGATGQKISNETYNLGSDGKAQTTLTFGNLAGDYEVTAYFNDKKIAVFKATYLENLTLSIDKPAIETKTKLKPLAETISIDTISLNLISNIPNYFLTVHTTGPLTKIDEPEITLPFWDGSKGLGFKISGQEEIKAFSTEPQTILSQEIPPSSPLPVNIEYILGKDPSFKPGKYQTTIIYTLTSGY